MLFAYINRLIIRIFRYLYVTRKLINSTISMDKKHEQVTYRGRNLNATSKSYPEFLFSS